MVDVCTAAVAALPVSGAGVSAIYRTGALAVFALGARRDIGGACQ
ncbi:hypothetical protein [Streptomyces sp. V1I1]|nr:hypothetical protein [Streptomyces sp. V1I1]MDQ0943732.1 hypothetical protein [Streptomyces sp. V1I1]